VINRLNRSPFASGFFVLITRASLIFPERHRSFVMQEILEWVHCDVQDGKMLLLLEALGKRQPVKFIGEFECATYDFQEGPDRDGDLRKTIRFHLLPIGSGAVTAFNEEDEIDLPISRGVTLSELRQQAFNAVLPEDADNWKEAKVRRRLGSVAIRRYMLARANGFCEQTGDPASFLTTPGLPNLEV